MNQLFKVTALTSALMLTLACAPKTDQNDGGITPPDLNPQTAVLNPATGFYDGTLSTSITDSMGVVSTTIVDLAGAVSASSASNSDAADAIFYSLRDQVIYGGNVTASSASGSFNTSLRRYPATDVSDYSIEGAFDQSAVYAGSVSARDTIQATNTKSAAENSALDLVFSASTSDQASSQAIVAGTYTAADAALGRTMTLTIATDGALSGVDSRSCTYSGSVIAPTQKINVYAVSNMIISCPGTPAAATSGLAVLDGSTLQLGVRNTTKAFLFELSR